MDTNKPSGDPFLTHIGVKPPMWNRRSSSRCSHSKEQPVRERGAARPSSQADQTVVPAACLPAPAAQVSPR